MELLFVTLGGVLLGLAARYAFPGRSTHGSLLVPSVGAAAAAIVWVALTWAGMPWDGGWIWVLALVSAGLSSAALAVLLGRRRTHSDAEALERASRA